jgi:archaellum component FlaC
MTPQMIEELLQDPVFRLKFLELLDRDPAFREEVRRKLLTDELLALPERVERLRLEIHKEFERVWRAIQENNRQIAALTERMERVETQIATLAQQVQENSRQIAALTERMERVETQIATLAQQVQENSRQIAALTERMERVETQIATLAQQVQENSRQIAALTERMERVETQIATLAQQVQENSRQIAALTERMERVEAQIAALTEEVRDLRRTVGRMEERWGLAHENMAEDLMPRFLASAGRRVRRSAMVQFDGEADLVLEVEETDGRRVTWVVEVKGRVWGPRPFEQVLERIRDAAFRSWLQREGFPEPVIPAVFGLAIYAGAEAMAQKLGVGLYEARRGEVVAPPLPEP